MSSSFDALTMKIENETKVKFVEEKWNEKSAKKQLNLVFYSAKLHTFRVKTVDEFLTEEIIRKIDALMKARSIWFVFLFRWIFFYSRLRNFINSFD